ncbi:hypothetical protein N431DRAFT_556675 [Stipitochalara longipes BDJ]|nr:hypothetical protein N431DRAFT_556675 [Stipitochalara longipes BDJ]
MACAPGSILAVMWLPPTSLLLSSLLSYLESKTIEIVNHLVSERISSGTLKKPIPVHPHTLHISVNYRQYEQSRPRTTAHDLCQFRLWHVPRFRLINRDCAAVGLEYLVPELELHFHRNSWKAHSYVRLQAIASHPIMSKGVREILHDSHTFRSPMKDFESWKANAMENLKRLNSGRANGQVLELNPGRSRSDFKRLYAWYQVCMREQEYFVDQRMDAPILRDSFVHLTNLEKITMNTWNTMYQTDVHSPTQLSPYRCWGIKNQVEKASSGSSKLAVVPHKCFHLEQDLIIGACESLTSLHLVLNCWGEEKLGEETPDCYRFLRKTSAIGVFLGKLPHLESLRLQFDNLNMKIGGGRCFPARLTDLIRKGHVWPKLRKLELGIFETSESQLVGLLERHASTLKHFGLKDYVEMDAGGSWISVLRKMKSFLKLEKMRIEASLSTKHSIDSAPERWSVFEHYSSPALIGEKGLCPEDIEDYLIRNGPVPLTDNNCWRLP